ncbi:microneme protein 5 [Cyclospora cayetanensis]|uniref:Microneme protein 5 n=1 Tax=Cyclospora cayetanensis TaxID=88456 RepID=A0A1D3CXV2_9EIME|nr:microneme protein 5 [Cyclospora cayetanensis]
MVVALSNQERTEAWNAAKHQDVEADQSFDAQSMIEAQWGTPYTHLPTIQAPDGSLVVVFETVSGEEKAYAVNVGPQNECAGMGTLVDNGKSEVLETLSSISSADDCQELCAQTRYCIGAIYDEYASTCSLMKSLRGLTRGLSTLVVPSCDSECFQKGKKFIEDGTSLGFAPNPNICQAMCEGEPTCRAFTWKDQQCVSYPNGALTAADANAVVHLEGSNTSQCRFKSCPQALPRNAKRDAKPIPIVRRLLTIRRADTLSSHRNERFENGGKSGPVKRESVELCEEGCANGVRCKFCALWVTKCILKSNTHGTFNLSENLHLVASKE